MRHKVNALLIIITVGLVIAAIIGHQAVTWRDAPRPLQSGVQPSGTSGMHRDPHGAIEPQDGVQGCFTPNVELAVECLEHAPRCPYEDGDPSGWPCLWVDPTTGVITYRDSSEYWS